jgi:PKD repeat protein
VSPASGTAPVQVIADASTSTDPQGQTMSYVFDFGDGSSTGSQTGATASHTFAAAGGYLVKVTVTNASGLSSTKTQTVTVNAPTASPPSFVSAVATNYSTSTKSSGYITVWRAAGVRAGDLLVLTLQLGGTAATGAVSATDAAGNTYTQAASVSDGAGNRLVVLSGVATRALTVDDRITATFPTATSYRLIGDEFAGASRVDTSAGATGGGTTFSSGSTQATAGNEIAFGAVSIPVGSANPAWSTSWRDLGAYSVSGRYLGRASQLPVSGAQVASGTASGAWLAAVVTLRP